MAEPAAKTKVRSKTRLAPTAKPAAEPPPPPPAPVPPSPPPPEEEAVAAVAAEGTPAGSKKGSASDEGKGPAEGEKKGSGSGEAGAGGEDGDDKDEPAEHAEAHVKEKNPCLKSCGRFMYNKKEHTVMGRGCLKWTLLLIFYILFYLALASFFLGLFGIILAISNKESPRMLWVKGKPLIGRSFIQQHPSFVAIPGPDRTRNKDASLMVISPAYGAKWGQKIDDFLNGYTKYLSKNPGCGPPQCFPYVRADLLPTCLLDNYGYTKSPPEPSFIFRPTKIIGWKPEPFKDQADFEKVLREKYPRLAAQWSSLTLLPSKDHVMVLCQGESAWDDALMGPITYCTPTHLENTYYPYKNKGTYLPPFVMIQLTKPALGVPMTVECYVVSKNMIVNKRQSLGMDRFEILVQP